MAKQATKKPSALSKAKAEIKELKEKLSVVNVKLDDNVVTHDELKWLKIYKGISIFAVGYVLVQIVRFIF